ncbi:MAG: DUF21 domain-containing protein [Streptosporangiales bacterium]|nr:DUF21 domain-containing protein [Streptosporangiales bacterium]
MIAVLREVGLILLFVLIGGVFAAAEIALVSLRDGQLSRLALRGRRGARVARLAADPNRFLSAVQIGVTVMGFLSAAFGGATIASRVAPLFTGVGLTEAVANTAALVLVTIAISYVSIVLGELAAKRLALQRAEGFALALAPLVDRIAVVLRPVIWLLSKSTDVVVRVLGGDPNAQREEMSEQELREVVSGHETLGTEERHIVTEVFRAVDRQVREVMVPRTEVDFLDADDPLPDAVAFARGRQRSRYPVIRGSADDVAGFVHVRDLFDRDANTRATTVGDLVREIVLLPWSAKVLPTLSRMRRGGAHVAVVVDEYGGTAGIVTLEDLIEVLVGDIRDEYDREEDAATQLAGGDIEVDGLLNLEDFSDTTGIRIPDGPYETVAGFVIAQLGYLPQVGESVQVDHARLVVSAVQGRRIAKLRVVTATPAARQQGR